MLETDQTPTLTLVVVDDAELDADYLATYIGSLRELNADALDDVHVTILSQRPRAANALRLAAEQPFPVDVIHARHICVEGYPLWDVHGSMRRLLPWIRGKYLSIQHAEFFWCAGRLAKTIAQLRQVEPTIALGNLRRPGVRGQIQPGDKSNRCSKADSDPVWEAACDSDFRLAGELAESMRTVRWAWNCDDEPEGWTRFSEDVLFLQTDWLREMEWYEHEQGLWFQDIYDVIRVAWKDLRLRNLAPDCYRLSRETHQQFHLWHACEFRCFTDPIRDWFLARADQKPKAAIGRRELWDALQSGMFVAGNQSAPVVQWRYEGGSTTARWLDGFCRWMSNGGTAIATKYKGQPKCTAKC